MTESCIGSSYYTALVELAGCVANLPARARVAVTRDAAVERAVRKALLVYKKLGNPVATWRDGMVVWIPPEEIEVDDDWPVQDAARSGLSSARFKGGNPSSLSTRFMAGSVTTLGAVISMPIGCPLRA